MTGIVLAGGENRRMGTNKAFLTVAGIPMIEHILGSLRSAASRIIIVTNSPDSYARYDVSLVKDFCDKRGPLTGIYSGLRASGDEYNIVVACDMPFLNPKLLTYMAGLAGEHDVIVPKIGEVVEPLHAVYHRKLLPVIEDHVKREQQRIWGIFKGQRVRYLTEEEIDRFDPGRRSFVNLNTQEEYRKTQCSDSECRN